MKISRGDVGSVAFSLLQAELQRKGLPPLMEEGSLWFDSQKIREITAVKIYAEGAVQERYFGMVEDLFGRISLDLPKACAINSTGYVIADRVIVVKKDGTLPVFSAERFAEKKITLPNKDQGGCRFVAAFSNKDTMTAVQMVRAGECGAVICRAHNLKYNDDFVVDEKFVTFLPDSSGGMVAEV